VENLRLVGEAYLERGDTEQAIGVFREVLGIVPEAFFAREQIARVYENLKKVPEAVGEWLELARSYARFGLLNRALQRMLNVVRLEPAAVEHRRRLIDLREAIGDEQGAARDYAALGELYQAQGQLDLAGACLARSLELDPSEESYQERARALRPETGGAGKVLAGLAWLLVVVAGVGAWGHRSARAAFVAARQGAVDAALEGDFPAAYAALADYRALYGWQHVLPRSALEDLIARRDLERADDERAARLRVAEALPRWAATLRPDLERYAQQEQRARELVQQASEHAEHGRGTPLLDAARELAGDELAWTEAARGFRVQVRLESLPPGAQVARDGVSLGSCPLAVEVGVEPLELLLTRAGSAPTTLRLGLRDEALELEHEVYLPPEQLWSAAAQGPIRERPAVGRGRVVVCGEDQRARLVGKGGEQWAVQLDPDEFPVRAPELTRDAVLVATTTRLRVLELEDGRERWSLHNPPGVNVLGAYADRIALARGRSLRLISAQTHEVLGEEALPGDVISGEVSGSYAVLSTGGPHLCAVALRTQQVAKTVPVPRRVSSVPLFTEFGFVALDEDLRLRLVHTEERWAVTLPGPLAAPLVYSPGDTPLLWSATGNALACIKLESGRGRWSRVFEQPIVDLAVAARAFVATSGGEVWCLDLETGEPRWRYLASGPAKLVATRDVLYVADAGGGIVALPVD